MKFIRKTETQPLTAVLGLGFTGAEFCESYYTTSTKGRLQSSNFYKKNSDSYTIEISESANSSDVTVDI